MTAESNVSGSGECSRRRTTAMRNLERAWASPAAKPNRERNREKGRLSGPQSQRAIGNTKAFREARARALDAVRASYGLPPVSEER